MKKRTKERIGKVAKIVLRTVAVSGLLAMALCAPNALQALGVFDKRKRRPFHINKVAERLKRDGYLRKVEKGRTVCYELTAKGRQFITRFELREQQIPRPEKWDGRYRMIIFDISEKRRHIRNDIRNWLRTLGFVKLQQSVWVFPYPCRKIVALLKTEYKVEKDVLYVTAAIVEHDEWLREEFGLE